MELEIEYYKDWYEVSEKIQYHAGDIYYKTTTTSPITDKNPKEFISSYIAGIDGKDDGYKITRVLSSKVEYMNTNKFTKNKQPKIKQPMKRSFVLRNDWLTYSHGISKLAYDDAEGKCVYYQLSHFLLNPPTGNPTKFINKRRTSEEALFYFFQEFVVLSGLCDDYPDFDINYGVSAEMIEALCKSIKRNMYAYDDENKIFLSVTSFPSKNYCPLVFYKLHGHCYLIDDPSVFKSVAESNKQIGNKIISSTIQSNNDIEHSLNVTRLESFDISNAKNLQEGVYLIMKSNLDAEIVDFIKMYKFVPQTKTTNSSITQIKFQVGFETKPKKDRKFVVIAVDVTNGEPYKYEQIKRVAECNKIQYTNEGIGSLVLSVLDNSNRHCREFLTEQQKKSFLEDYNHQCRECDLKCEYLEIDHIIPLAAGGDNSIHNLQPLCKDCHLKKTKEEKELGMYKPKDETSSIFNKISLDYVVNTNEFKTFQFVEKVNNEPIHEVPVYFDVKVKESIVKSSNIFKTDMRKCRRNLTKYSKYEFPIFSVMDIPRPFSGMIQCGLFFVETELIYPFRGNGWYSQPLVQYALDTKLIALENIRAEFIPSNKLTNDYFQKPIDTLLSAFQCEPDLQKLSVNSMIGLFGRTKNSSSHTKFTLCPFEASTWWGEKEANSNVFIRTIPLDNDVNLYEGIFSESVDIEATKYPIYKQILEMEAVELHKLESIIIKKGGVILDRNTDAIRYSRDKEIEFSNYFWDDEKTVIKYQKEQPRPLKNDVLKGMKRDAIFDLSVFELEWNTQYDYDLPVQDEANRIVESNKSYHIDGRAGTGKSFLVNAIISKLKTDNKKYLAFSPTNKGARIIGGNTIHSVYFKYQNSKKKLFQIIEGIDYIFIDEVSMMVKEFYQLFTLIKRTFKSIKFIIAGDFGQLPPVKDSWTGDYENSPAMNLLCDGNKIKLMTCRRADDKLYNLCLNPVSVDISQYKVTELTYLNIAYTHKTRRTVNTRCMERFINENKCDTINLEMDKFNPKTQDVKLAVGMPVIAHTTNKKLRILNSQTFKIQSINEDKMEIVNGEESISIKTKDFHKFFYIGFCLTIHASQGETFDKKYTIYDWNKLCEKAKYVALSRGTKIENIQIQ